MLLCFLFLSWEGSRNSIESALLMLSFPCATWSALFAYHRVWGHERRVMAREPLKTFHRPLGGSGDMTPERPSPESDTLNKHWHQAAGLSQHSLARAASKDREGPGPWVKVRCCSEEGNIWGSNKKSHVVLWGCQPCVGSGHCCWLSHADCSSSSLPTGTGKQALVWTFCAYTVAITTQHGPHRGSWRRGNACWCLKQQGGYSFATHTNLLWGMYLFKSFMWFHCLDTRSHSPVVGGFSFILLFQ